MKRIETNELLEVLNWRYATKKFDPTKKIPADVWETLRQTLLLTPSSFGLQPWKFIEVVDPAIREKLVAASWNQRQVADADRMVVFAVPETLDEAHVDRYLAKTAAVQKVPVESLAGYRKMLVGTLGYGVDWFAKQAYIALGNFMTSAALLGVDTCPMEGLEPKQYDEILGLTAMGYRTVFACPAGYRAVDDAHAKRPKVRFDEKDVFLKIG